MRKDLPFDVRIVPAVKPGSTAGEGLVIDRINFKTCLIGLAVASIASGSLKAKIQHGNSKDGKDMEDFKPDGEVIYTDILTKSDTNTQKPIDLTGAKKYIRIVTESTGTIANFSAFIALGDKIDGGVE